MRKSILPGVILILVFVHCAKNDPLKSEENVPVEYVNPFVGTLGLGNTYPGAVAPFGMIQISPDTEKEERIVASGYDYSDTTLLGFSLTHLSGTGISDLGDILFVPSVGRMGFTPEGNGSDPGYRTSFSHDEESASPGYYSVVLPEHGVQVEITAADRSGMFKLTFPETDSANVMTDLSHVLWSDVIWSNVRFENDSLVTGYHQVSGWARERFVYFAAEYSRAPTRHGILKDGQPVEHKRIPYHNPLSAAGKNLQYFVTYHTRARESILVKVGISAVSTANALMNLRQEIPHWDFEQVARETRSRWNRELGRIEIEASEKDKRTFYTALYHSFLTPTLYEDVNGHYIGFDQNVHRSDDFTNYAVFSLWDTYRALHPLFALVQSERNVDMVNSMLAHFDQSADHLLPVWSLYSNETWTMIGYHAVPVIVDAYLKNNKGFDIERAYRAIRATATTQDYDAVEEYSQLGYVPCDVTKESVSKTLEYAFDDYCISRLAASLGNETDADYFKKRAYSYQNVFDQGVSYMRGKDSRGNWRESFNPYVYMLGGDYTQGSASQYTWYVPHDVNGLMQLMGGERNFTDNLDAFFLQSDNPRHLEEERYYGRIGQYWHGNEPSHHIALLYNYAGQAFKSQKLVSQIMSTLYGDEPGSLCGHDDCGQLSAWYVFNALGFYPVCPGSDEYVFGSPRVQAAVIHLACGKRFEVNVDQYAPENIYIQSITLNGKPWEKTYLPFDEIHKGGEIIFTMGPNPQPLFGRGPQNYPHSMTRETRVPMPYIASGPRYFLESTRIVLDCVEPEAVIRYTLDGSDPDENSPQYRTPLAFSDNVVIKARAFHPEKESSMVLSETLTKASLQMAKTVREVLPGLRYDFFRGEMVKTDMMKIPENRGIVHNFDISEHAGEENFGYIFSGYLRIPRDGIYTFYLTSDDGSKLYIGGRLLIDNDFHHSALQKSADIALAKGLHPIMVKFFEGQVREYLSLEWEGPAIAREKLPDDVLFH